MSPSKLDEAVDRVKSAIGRDGDVPTAEGVEGPVGVVRGALQAWGEGDLDAFFKALDGDVEWIAPKGEFPGGGSTQGRDEVREKLTSAVEDAYEDFGFRPEHFLEADELDWVVVLGTFDGSPLKGATLRAPGVMVWEMDGKRASRVRIYADGEAFAAPGPDKEEQEQRMREREEKDGERDEQDGERDEQSDDGPRAEAGDEQSDDDTRAEAGDEHSDDGARAEAGAGHG